jgi:hypothetical protein
MHTEWEQYQCNVRAQLSGRLQLGVPVVQAVPLILDKDCRKVLKKLKKAKSKLRVNTSAAQPPAEVPAQSRA